MDGCVGHGHGRLVLWSCTKYGVAIWRLGIRNRLSRLRRVESFATTAFFVCCHIRNREKTISSDSCRRVSRKNKRSKRFYFETSSLFNFWYFLNSSHLREYDRLPFYIYQSTMYPLQKIGGVHQSFPRRNSINFLSTSCSITREQTFIIKILKMNS